MKLFLVSLYLVCMTLSLVFFVVLRLKHSKTWFFSQNQAIFDTFIFILLCLLYFNWLYFIYNFDFDILQNVQPSLEKVFY